MYETKRGFWASGEIIIRRVLRILSHWRQVNESSAYQFLKKVDYRRRMLHAFQQLKGRDQISSHQSTAMSRNLKEESLQSQHYWASHQKKALSPVRVSAIILKQTVNASPMFSSWLKCNPRFLALLWHKCCKRLKASQSKMFLKFHIVQAAWLYLAIAKWCSIFERNLKPWTEGSLFFRSSWKPQSISFHEYICLDNL